MQESKVLINIKCENPEKVIERLESYFIDSDGMEEFMAYMDYDGIEYGRSVEMEFEPIED